MDDFNYVSQIVHGIRFTIWDPQRTFKDQEKDLGRREAELVALGNASIYFGRHIERATNISQSLEQATALESELERFRKTIKEQPDLLMQDFV